MVKVYLDTSALVKRYIEEEGTDLLDLLFSKASRYTRLVISLWNLTESMVALDKYRNRNAISDQEVRGLINGLLAEIREHWKKGFLTIVPLHPDLLVEAWRYILGQHVYAGDAVQLATFARERCDFLLAADKKLLEVCRTVGIECFNPESRADRQVVTQRLS